GPPALPRQPLTGPRRRTRGARRAVADHGGDGPRGRARVAPQRPGRAAGARALDPAHRPVDELLDRHWVARLDNAVMMRRVATDGIGGRRVAREPQRLAAAAAEVLLLAPERAGPPRLL